MRKDELKPHVRRQIDHGLDAITDEFNDVAAPEEVRKTAEEELEKVLNEARFDDFVPTLVNSSTRERLLDEANQESDACESSSGK
jgi:hypothetical protein